MTIRITIFIKKLPTVSIEHFHKYWSEEHPKIFLSVPIVQKNLTHYQQFHSDPNISAELRKMGLPIAEYDGGAEFFANSVEDAMAVFQDPEYHRIVVPDEMTFLDRDAASMMIGTTEVKWEDGKPAEGVKVHLVQ
ncbi:hypothetical protein LTR86_000707 [Recurvomyces mirabilis]|nr:hypothetical protein LTR86_000707 [Recurvomyces mirabilis]